jgi:hypothetical protein
MPPAVSTDAVGPSREFFGRWSVTDVGLATTHDEAKHHFRGTLSLPGRTIHDPLYKKYSQWLQENLPSNFWILQFAAILRIRWRSKTGRDI